MNIKFTITTTTTKIFFISASKYFYILDEKVTSLFHNILLRAIALLLSSHTL